MRRTAAQLAFAFLLLALLSVAFLPAARGDTVQKVSVGGRPDAPIVDTTTGDVYVVNDGEPGNPSNSVSVISGTSLAATLSLNSTRGSYLGSPLTNLRTATYDSGNGYIYVPDAAGVGTPLAVVSGTQEVGNPDVGYAAAQATYDPNNGYVYIPDGDVVKNLCTVDCITSTGAVNNLGLGVGYCIFPGSCQPFNATKGTNNSFRQVTVEYGQISVVSGLTSVGNITIGWDSSDPYNPNVPAFNESQDPTVTPAFDPNNNLVYVADTKLDVIYAISGTSVVGTISVGSESVTPVVDPTNGYVYVANSQSDSISVIDYTSVVATISLSGVVGGLVYDPGNGYLYADGTSNIWVISGNSVMATLAFGSSGGAAYDSNNGYLYFSEPLNGTIDAINGTTIAYTDKVGGEPTSMAFDPVNGNLYASDDKNGVVDVVSPASGIGISTSCTSSSSSTVRSSSTTSTSTTTAACCSSQSQTQSHSSSTTTSASSSCTSVATVGSSASQTTTSSSGLVTSTGSGGTGPTSSTASLSSTVTTPPPAGGISTGTLEIAGGAVGAAVIIGGALYYYTQGGSGSESEGGECGSPPGCGPYSGPACSPSSSPSAPGENCPDLVAHASPCYAVGSGSVATASGPSMGQECSLSAHAKRGCETPTGCFATASGPTVNESGCPLVGHATRNCSPSSGCSFATAKGPSVASSSQQPGTTPCSTAEDSSASATSSVRITCKPACLPSSSSSFAQVKQCAGGASNATRAPTTVKGSVKQVKPSCSAPNGCSSTAEDTPSCAT